MTTSEIIAIGGFCVSITAIVFSLGKMASRLEKAESDINKLGLKVDRNSDNCDGDNRELERKIAGLAESFGRLDQKVSGLDRGETIGRMRGNG